MRYDWQHHVVHAAGRSWPAVPDRAFRADIELPAAAEFDLPNHTMCSRGVRVMFESGWAASIVWGSLTYSSNHDHPFHADAEFTEEPTTVEVGVIDHTGVLRQRIHEPDTDEAYADVECYLDDEQLAYLLDQLAIMPSSFDYGERPPTADEVRQWIAEFNHLHAINLNRHN